MAELHGARQPTEEIVLGTGDVQITLRWDSTTDLDLHVVDPSGFEIYYVQPQSPTGGQLDVDMIPCARSDSSFVENVFWPSGESPAGDYLVWVHYHPSCNDQGPVDYQVTVTVDGREPEEFTGTLNRPQDQTDVTQFSK